MSHGGGGGSKEEVGFAPVVATLFEALLSLTLVGSIESIIKEVTYEAGGGHHH